MTDLTAQKPARATIEIPNLALNNRMSATTSCQKNTLVDKTSTAARHGALARITSSGISTGLVAPHTPTQSLQTLSLGVCRARASFSSESVIIPGLDASRSRAV